ncbi:hypothetical protein T01_1542, partial [Trichinella spiralis]
MSTFVPPPQVRVLQRQLRIKITFRHPVEGDDCSHVYVEHCHQLRHVHLDTEALRHLTADVGLIQVRDEHFRTSTAGS